MSTAQITPALTTPHSDKLYLVTPPLKAAEVARTHLFVHTVRFWSMVGIIAMHSLPPLHVIHSLSPNRMQLAIQPFKFGTIGFFLISGFLMGERLETCKPFDYLRRRLATIFTPWLFWLMILSIYLFLADAAHHRITLTDPSTLAHSLSHAIAFCFRRTPYWFVPNLLIGMSMLLLFRRHLYSLRFGVIFLSIDLFYVVNIYTHWLPSQHTDATFGFIFYLWLGAFTTRHIDALQRFLAAVPMSLLVAATVLACTVAIAESRLLQTLSAPDPMNTLRLSNQVFSVLAVLVMLRIPRPSWPHFVDVPAHTFGLYLTHPLCLVAILSIVHHAIAPQATAPQVLLVWAIIFTSAYSSALLLTKSIASVPGLGKIVGAKPKRVSASAKTLTLPNPALLSVPATS